MWGLWLVLFDRVCGRTKDDGKGLVLKTGQDEEQDGGMRVQGVIG